MAVTIVYAPPRYGKTCYMTYMAREVAFDHERTRAMQKELFEKQANGFEAIKTIPKHCVSANYDMNLRKFGYSPRSNRRINPFRLGFENKAVRTHFNFPHEAIFITEAQKYLNSRMSKAYPDWQSRWYEQEGHDDIDVWLDTQRPMLIDVNIRELASFIEIIHLDVQKDGFGNPKSFTWQIRKIPHSSAFDCYMASGKKDKECFEEEEVRADCDIFSMYDSQNCKPKFYEGHLEEDFDYVEAQPTKQTLAGYIKYLEENDDELPKGFYIGGKQAA